jgi:hypothetical protein
MSFKPPKQWTPDQDHEDEPGIAKTHNAFVLSQRLSDTTPEKEDHVVVNIYMGKSRLTQIQIRKELVELNNKLLEKPRQLFLVGQNTEKGLASTLHIMLSLKDMEDFNAFLDPNGDIELPDWNEITNISEDAVIAWPIGNYVRPNRDRKFPGDAQAEIEDQMTFILTKGPEDQGERALKHLIGD